MRLIDAEQFDIISLQGKSKDFVEGVEFMLNKIDHAPTIITLSDNTSDDKENT